VSHPLAKYLREGMLPTLFCPGCGNGILMKAMFEVFDEMGLESLDGFVFVSGIGCAGWIPSPHFKADSVHTLHGRAIPVATGIKLCRPELRVVVIGGDGDIAGIGCGHLIHAARRNVDIATVMVNNFNYGMTGGQYSPTTPRGKITPTSPYGNPERPMDTCLLVAEAGANYVARWTVAHYRMLKEALKRLFEGRGFRFLEVVSTCPTRVLRREGLTPAEGLKALLRASVPVRRCDPARAVLKGRIPVGVYADRDEPGFLEALGLAGPGVRRG